MAVALTFEQLADDPADERLLSRRRRSRATRMTSRGDGSTADGVRMYLREIGQVDLLTTEDERRLAQLIEAGHLAARAHRRRGRRRPSGATCCALSPAASGPRAS